MPRTNFWLWPFCGVWLILQPVWAYTNYEANYRVYWHGIHVGDSHHLRQQSAGLVHIAVETKARFKMPYALKEVSEFQLHKDGLRSKFYYYDYQEGQKTKKGQVTFDWKHQRILGINNGQGLELVMPKIIYDNLNFLSQIQLDLQNGARSFSYPIFDKGKLRHYHFQFAEEQAIASVLGPQEVVLLSYHSDDGRRQTLVWLAKNLDYLPLKMRQLRQKRTISEAILHNLKPSA